MREIVRKYFRMYLPEGEETEEEQWEDTKEIVDLCMKLLLGLAIVEWAQRI